MEENMKTWEMIEKSKFGDRWYSETLGYTIIHTSRGFVSINSKKHPIKASNNFLRATDWRRY